MRFGTDPGALGVAEQRRLDAAIDDAFAPLRRRTAPIGPARARAAARWTHGEEPTPLPRVAFFARLGEVSVAVAVSAFLFSGSMLSAPERRELDGSSATVASLERTLNGRLADQHPISSGSADYRMARSDDVVNAASVRRRAPERPLAIETHDGLSINP